MCIKRIIVSVVFIFSLLGFPTKDEATELKIVSPADMTINGQITYYSNLYRVDESIIKKVIQCESKGVISAVGDSGLSRGIAQFQKSTFINLSNKLGEELDYNSSHDQIKLMVWSIANGYGSNWTAWRAINNGGTYSFYSNQLKKHFVVYCK